MLPSTAYAPVPSEESPRDSNFQPFSVADRESNNGNGRLAYLWSPRAVVITVWILSCGIAFTIGLRWPRDLGAMCINHANLHFPISQDLGLHYHDLDFDAKLTRGNIYRENASVEVDKAWDELGLFFKPMIVSEDVGVRSGIPPGNAKLPLKNGGGFIAMVQVFHQLHCLNLLRKAAWFNYDYYSNIGEHEFANSPEVLQMHVGHCFDFLRQQLMCTADVGLVSFVWVEGQPGPVADFSTKHRCKDFEAIKQWTKEKQADKQQVSINAERRPGDRLEEYP
ncbi:hypothetical protein EG329_004311 [Mollisiaceae sp. DMI_Dod_QoI]|nr:hypothetical protein EG329_004311 [Helotiales sp. DMI_Dod_QoI]